VPRDDDLEIDAGWCQFARRRMIDALASPEIPLSPRFRLAESETSGLKLNNLLNIFSGNKEKKKKKRVV
jgi:hypothetical protein